MSDKAYVNVGVHSDLELGSRPNTPGFSPPSNQLKSSKTIYVYDGGDGEITLERLLSILFDVRPFPPSRELTPEEVKHAKTMELKRKCMTKTGYSTKRAANITAFLNAFEAVAIILLIILNFLMTVPELGEATLLSILELILQLYLAVYVFLEIFMFTWACDYYPQYRGKGGRLRFLKTRSMLFDFFILALNIALAVLIILQFGSSESFNTGVQNAIQALRLLQLARLARLPFVKRAMTVLSDNMKDKLPTMVLVGVLAFFAMVIFSTLFYIVERSSNDKVESLPMSLYWATITSVTVGYGDISPVTGLGRLVAVLTCWIAVPMFSAIMGIFSTSVALNFETWEKDQQLRMKKEETTARMIQWWWRLRALQARAPTQLSWIREHIKDVQAGAVEVPMLKFEQAIGAEGELTLVGTMQVQSERRRSSAFANLQRGYTRDVRSFEPNVPMISSISMSSVIGEGIAMHNLEGQSVRPGHVVATLLIFQLFKLMYRAQIEELAKTKSDVSTYELQKDTWRVQQAIDHMSTIQYLRHRASVRDQITMEGHMKEMTETMTAMKQQLDATQAALAEMTKQIQALGAKSV